MVCRVTVSTTKLDAQIRGSKTTHCNIGTLFVHVVRVSANTQHPSPSLTRTPHLWEVCQETVMWAKRPRLRPIPASSACSTVCDAACPSSWSGRRWTAGPSCTGPGRRGWRWPPLSPSRRCSPASAQYPRHRGRTAADLLPAGESSPSRGRSADHHSPWNPEGWSGGNPVPLSAAGCWTSNTPFLCRSRWSLMREEKMVRHILFCA